MRTTDDIEAMITHAQQHDLDELELLVAALDDAARSDLEGWTARALRDAPHTFNIEPGDARVRRRHVLERLHAELAATRGDLDALIDLLWTESARNDGKRGIARVVHLMIDAGREEEAAAIARFRLHQVDDVERAQLIDALDRIDGAPAGWHEALAEFATNPSVDAWRALHRFTPHAKLYDRVRNSMRVFMEMGVDANVLFRCATDGGTLPDAIELVEKGLVDVDVVVERANEGNPICRATWLGLAARAAFAHGDRFRTVKLLREAFTVAHEDFQPMVDAWCIRDVADTELHEMLDKAGIPR